MHQDGHNGQPAGQQPYVGLPDRDYFHIMLNLDSYQDFLPTAWSLANHFLDEARRVQADPSLEPELRPFHYTTDNFEARLDQIYQGLVDDVNRYEATRAWALRTRDDVVEWIRQMAPFNQTDGARLRNIVPVGPVDEVHSLLVNILMDEVGGGDPELNHANIYTELLHSVDINLRRRGNDRPGRRRQQPLLQPAHTRRADVQGVQ